MLSLITKHGHWFSVEKNVAFELGYKRKNVYKVVAYSSARLSSMDSHAMGDTINLNASMDQRPRVITAQAYNTIKTLEKGRDSLLSRNVIFNDVGLTKEVERKCIALRTEAGVTLEAYKRYVWDNAEPVTNEMVLAHVLPGVFNIKVDYLVVKDPTKPLSEDLITDDELYEVETQTIPLRALTQELALNHAIEMFALKGLPVVSVTIGDVTYPVLGGEAVG